MRKNKFWLLLSLLVWCNSMFAQVVVFNPAKDKSGSDERNEQSVTKEGVTIRLDDQFNIDPTLNNSSNVYKFYASGVLSISSTNRNILKVVLVKAPNSDSNFEMVKDLSTNKKIETNSTKTEAVWTGSSKEVKLVNSSKVVWLSEIRVTVDAFSISESNYATLYLPNSFKMPEGVVGHTILVDKGVLSYGITYNSGEVVPAETALLIEGKPGNYVYEVSSTSNAKPTNNALKGSDDGKTVNLNNYTSYLYKLSYKSETDKTIGFYWDVEDGKSVTVPAGRCYLSVPKSAFSSDSPTAAKGFALNSFVNEIGGVKVEETAGDKIYNVSGIYVGDDIAKLKTGLYIRNGKKVVIR